MVLVFLAMRGGCDGNSVDDDGLVNYLLSSSYNCPCVHDVHIDHPLAMTLVFLFVFFLGLSLWKLSSKSDLSH
jgi:hypothetical protein